LKLLSQALRIGSLLLGLMAAGAAPAVQEIRNGGSVLVGGRVYQLGDLHFRPLPHEGFGLDQTLEAELRRIRHLVTYRLGIDFNDFDGREFFEEYVFNPYVEFRLVAKLPAHCRFYDAENLPPNAQQEHVGCTDGAITFIDPAVYSKLPTVLDQALFIIHERLHALAPLQPYDLKTDLVLALYLISNAYREDAPELTEGESLFSPEELRVVNRLNRRIRQLTGRIRSRDFMTEVRFTHGGGTFIFRQSAGSIVPEDFAQTFDPSVLWMDPHSSLRFDLKGETYRPRSALSAIHIEKLSLRRSNLGLNNISKFVARNAELNSVSFDLASQSPMLKRHVEVINVKAEQLSFYISSSALTFRLGTQHGGTPAFLSAPGRRRYLQTSLPAQMSLTELRSLEDFPRYFLREETEP